MTPLNCGVYFLYFGGQMAGKNNANIGLSINSSTESFAVLDTQSSTSYFLDRNEVSEWIS